MSNDSQDIPFKEKIQSIQFSGMRSKPVVKIDDEGNKRTQLLDESGDHAGFTTEHGSGRVDANVNLVAPDPVTVTI